MARLYNKLFESCDLGLMSCWFIALFGLPKDQSKSVYTMIYITLVLKEIIVINGFVCGAVISEHFLRTITNKWFAGISYIIVSCVITTNKSTYDFNIIVRPCV